MYHVKLFGTSPVDPPLLGRDFGVRVIYVLAAVMMMLSPFVLIVLSKNHFLAAWRLLAHVNVWVAKVVVVTPGGLVPLMMERAFLVLDAVPWGSWGDGLFTLVRAQVILLG